MTAYLGSLIDLVLRGLHVVAVIAWVGSSFYFMWLERRLSVPAGDPERDDVVGDLWALHSGSIYHSQKYTSISPTPSPLYRFRWPAYTTWLSGIALMCVIYYANAELYLVEPGPDSLSPGAAVAASVALIVATWCVYHFLCDRLTNDRYLAAAGVLLLPIASMGVCALFSGRGAFVQMGAMLGTAMVANVFFVIMRAQREILAALARGERPDPAASLRARRRSLHNNYLTLPVLFCMLSPHYPLLYGQPHNSLVLSALMLAGALARHAVNVHHAGKRPWAWGLACAAVLTCVGASTATPAPIEHGPAVSLADVRTIVELRCMSCHATAPTSASAAAPPSGVSFESDDDLIRWASRIHERTVASRTMPLNNVTGMTEAERMRIDHWFRSGVARD